MTRGVGMAVKENNTITTTSMACNVMSHLQRFALTDPVSITIRLIILHVKHHRQHFLSHTFHLVSNVINYSFLLLYSATFRQ